MAIEFYPIVGNWYEDLDNGQRFEVLEVDEDRRITEIQYPNGEVDEIDLSDWYDMDLEPVEDSEEWTGSAEEAEPEELQYTESDEEENWRSRSTRSRRSWDEEEGEEEEEHDEWDEGYSERWDRDE